VALCSTERWIELEIPPDTGNGAANAGIPLARLLWALPVPQLVALLEALLLEKRVLLLGPEPDTVSAATQAAAALLYPFRWVHIFLPLLPHGLKVGLAHPGTNKAVERGRYLEKQMKGGVQVGRKTEVGTGVWRSQPQDMVGRGLGCPSVRLRGRNARATIIYKLLLDSFINHIPYKPSVGW
jgi:hypothetical protein